MALGCGDYSCSCVVCIVSLEKFKVGFSEGAKKKKKNSWGSELYRTKF